ncbi:hypothetical protein [Vibrio parahaemolyticus]
MTISHLRPITALKSLGQTLLLFVLGACLLFTSSFLMTVTESLGRFTFIILVGTLPFLCFYLAGFLLSPKCFYQQKVWRTQSSTWRWFIFIVCALSGEFYMGELNGIAEASATDQPMSPLKQLLLVLSAFALFTIVYLPLRLVSLFYCLNMGKVCTFSELLDKGHDDLFNALVLPSLLTRCSVFVLIAFVLMTMNWPNIPTNSPYLSLFLLEIVVVLDIAYVYTNRIKDVASMPPKKSAAFHS